MEMGILLENTEMVGLGLDHGLQGGHFPVLIKFPDISLTFPDVYGIPGRYAVNIWKSQGITGDSIQIGLAPRCTCE